jgi:ATP-binding protein involved in chromosome partitioning
MSWMELPDGTRMEPFGSGGGATVAASLTKTIGADVPLLGQVPLDPRVVSAGDNGEPIVKSIPDSEAAKELIRIATKLSTRARGLSGRMLSVSPA